MALIDSRESAAKPRPIEITITYNSSTNRLSVSPQTAQLSLHEPQTLVWKRSGDSVGDLAISFPANTSRIGFNTPFRTRFMRCPKQGACSSGVPLKDTARQTSYEYTITLTTPTFRKELTAFIKVSAQPLTTTKVRKTKKSVASTEAADSSVKATKKAAPTKGAKRSRKAPR